MIVRVVLILHVICFFGCTEKNIQNVKFNSDVWKEQTKLTDVRNERSNMIIDLIESKKLLGITKEEITKMLGDPDEDHQLKDYDLTYLVGPDRGYGIDFEWIGIRFNPDGLSDEIEIVVR